MKKVEKLLRVAGPAICEDPPPTNEAESPPDVLLWAQLRDLLNKRNGFYAFHSALHVFPAEASRRVIGLAAWNSETLWRAEYDEMVNDCWFFAEDLVGGQYCFYLGAIYKFDPETGNKSAVGGSIDEWCAAVLDNSEEETLWPLAEEWQHRNRPLSPGERLVPKVPFVLGGEFSSANLYAADAMKAMRFYAHLAKQIRDLPDGARVQLRAVE